MTAAAEAALTAGGYTDAATQKAVSLVRRYVMPSIQLINTRCIDRLWFEENVQDTAALFALCRAPALA